MTKALLRRFAALLLALAGWSAAAQPALPRDAIDVIRSTFGAEELRYFDRAVDLDGDGTPEILVYVVGPMACGTGG